MNRFILFTSALLAACAASACDICATHIALGSWQETGKLSLSLFNQYSKYDRPSGGGHELTSSQSQLAAGWRFNDRFAAQATLPYVDRELDGETTSGIGDASLIGIVRLYKFINGADATLLDVYAGLKLPTGDSDELAEERDHVLEEREHAMHDHADEEVHADHPHGHVVSPGSGSYDGIFGTRALAKRGKWQANAGVQYIARTEGDYDFQYGDELTLNAGARYYAILRDSGFLAIGADYTRDQRGQDQVLGEKQEKTPASAYIGPAIDAALSERLTIFAAWDFPIEGTDEGIHGAADQRARIGANFMF